MGKKNILASAVRSLLRERLPCDETEKLRQEGFNIKNPTRKAALAIALYKKAESGDISAIKELRGILDDKSTELSGKTVVIIDDTEKKTE